MTNSTRVVALLSSILVGASVDAAAQTSAAAEGRDTFVTQTAGLLHGRIEGLVTDDRGRPLAGVAVSAQGGDLNFAMTDRAGRYSFGALNPGTYWVRARLVGYSASARDVVQVRAADATTHAIRLRRVAVPEAPESTPRLVEAGLGTLPAETSAPEAPAVADLPPTDDIDRGTLAWRLRHMKRSVLRDEHQTPVDTTNDTFGGRRLIDPAVVVSAVEYSARAAASVFTQIPFSGQVRLLTTGSFDTPDQLFSRATAARSAAYFALQSPAGDWAVQGAMTTGDVSSWIVGGTYQLEPSASHDVHMTMSYATQRYEGGNPDALSAVSDGRRNVGTVGAIDHWAASRRVTVAYGAQYARYDYLDRSDLFSPNVSVAVSPLRLTWVHVDARQQMTAPGAEEFVPTSVAALFGPPERTFSPLVRGGVLRPERTRHLAVGVDRQVGSYIVGVRRFAQRIDDQRVTVFGGPADGASADLGHYFVAAAGGLDVAGWTVEVSRPLGSRMRGSVEYSVIEASGASLDGLTAAGRTLLARQRNETIHDVTGQVEAQIAETRTRVSALYKLNSGFAAPGADGIGAAFDGRFDVQVHQGLPAPSLKNVQWEVVVAVRNLFFAPLEGASTYDEVLVANPPKRVMGGLSVKF
ncbi:MAG: carboxypeptidase-like regulatory domain-containing protein [Vicinamibacterales bacterium]